MPLGKQQIPAGSMWDSTRVHLTAGPRTPSNYRRCATAGVGKQTQKCGRRVGRWDLMARQAEGRWDVSIKSNAVCLERISDGDKRLFEDSLASEEARALAELLTKFADKLDESDKSDTSDRSDDKSDEPDDSDKRDERDESDDSDK